MLNMDRARLTQSKSAYCEHPLRLVQIENFLQNPIAEGVSRFLTSQAAFGPIYGLHDVPKHVVDHDKWLASSEDNRFFHYEMLASIVDEKPSRDTLDFLKLRQFLSSDAFCEMARQIVNEPLASVSEARVHRLRFGHYLRHHNDRSGARKIAYILYLSRDWEKRFGGKLTLIGEGDLQQQVEPVFNSLVLFDVTRHKQHFIEALTQHARDFARDTIGGWFSNDATG
jgi:Rps23 Pro-64 3,4-dihydroxylase Tpa1-like proline 4-hydroxylase